MDIIIEIIKLIMVSAWLVVFSIIDIRTHKLPDKYIKWLLFTGLGFIVYNISTDFTGFVFSVVIVFVLTTTLYQFKGIGGADMKLLTSLSAIYPIQYQIYNHNMPFMLFVASIAMVGTGLYVIGKLYYDEKTVYDELDARAPFIPFILFAFLFAIISSTS